MKLKIDNIKKHTGFTLLEVLVVVSLFGIIGYIMAGTLERSLNGTTKTSLIGDVKQVGQSALDIMVPQIHNAAEIVCTTPVPPPVSYPNSSSGTVLVIKSKVLYSQNNTYFTRFIFDTTGPLTGTLIQDYPIFDPIKGDLITLCDTSGNYPISTATDYQELTDPIQAKIITIAAPSSPLFTYTPGQGSIKDTVTISFSLTPANPSINYANTLGNSNNSMPFETTVEVR